MADLPAADPPGHRDGAAVRTVGLGHAYVDGHDVLDGVDLDVTPGTRVALVGASGAGKTTLAKLVAGIHRPTRGEVHVGRSAMVTQEVHVFAGPLADDLRLAEGSADGVKPLFPRIE